MKNNLFWHNRTLPAPTEKSECLVLAQYLQIKKIKFTHIANERQTTVQHHMALRAMGVSPGFPDYIIFIPQNRSVIMESVILFIEMKRVKGGSISPEQAEWIAVINATAKGTAHVCQGFQDAKKIIDKYLKF